VPRTVNTFSGPYLERVAHWRKDAARVDGALQDATTLWAPVHRSRNLVRCDASGWSAGLVEGVALRASAAGIEPGEAVLLGRYAGRACFAIEVADPAPLIDSLAGGSGTLRFEDLRVAGAQLPASDAGLLAYARAMLHWRARHRFCSACGQPARSVQAGHVMQCTNPGCAAEHFPRLDPAIIVLVTDGERALLGRQAPWPPGRYSTIAGFVEPGESLEDAVAREVHEETGVTVLDAEYHSSQPWPFPSSLMVGFIARAAADAVPRADEELEDARWFTRHDIASGGVGLPPPLSVSFRLIEHWYDQGAELPLAATPAVRLWGAGSR
jgi:NAD+ diphosphatase